MELWIRECISTLSGHTKSISSLVYIPKTMHIVSGSNDKTIRIWDYETCECITTLKGHTDNICTITIIPETF